jgi:hypothetical protein
MNVTGGVVCSMWKYIYIFFSVIKVKVHKSFIIGLSYFGAECLRNSGGCDAHLVLLLGTDHLTWKGGVMVFCFVQNFFFGQHKSWIIYFFLSRKARNFFPEFNIRFYDKNSESDYLFSPPPKSEYFFQQHWESEYFFWKKPYPPPSSS